MPNLSRDESATFFQPPAKTQARVDYAPRKVSVSTEKPVPAARRFVFWRVVVSFGCLLHTRGCLLHTRQFFVDTLCRVSCVQVLCIGGRKCIGPVTCLLLLAGVGCSQPGVPAPVSGSTQSDAVISSAGLDRTEVVWDTGEIDPTKMIQLSRTFTIYNSLSVPVPVDCVKTNCGCMLIENQPKFIAPLSHGTFTVRYTLATVPGIISRLMQVELGSPVADSVTFRMNSLIKPARILSSLPARINFGEVPFGGSKERQATIRLVDGSPVTGLKIVSGLPAGVESAVFSESKIANLSSSILTLKVKNDFKLSRIMDMVLMFESESSGVAILNIPVRASFEGMDRAFRRLAIIKMDSQQIGGVAVELCQSSAELAINQFPEVTGIRVEGNPAIVAELLPNGGEEISRASCTALVNLDKSKLSPLPGDTHRGTLFIRAAELDKEIPIQLLIQLQ